MADGDPADAERLFWGRVGIRTVKLVLIMAVFEIGLAVILSGLVGMGAAGVWALLAYLATSVVLFVFWLAERAPRHTYCGGPKGPSPGALIPSSAAGDGSASGKPRAPTPVAARTPARCRGEPNGLVNPRFPEALDPTRPLIVFGASLALQAAGLAFLVFRSERAKTTTRPRSPDSGGP